MIAINRLILPRTYFSFSNLLFIPITETGLISLTVGTNLGEGKF